MKYALRHEQPRMVSEVFQHWKNGRKRVLLQCPTGGGKTIMFNHIVSLCEKKGYRVLIICDRRELITQSWQKLWDGHGIHAGIILSGVAPSYQLPVQIGSIQTLSKRNFPQNIDLVIIDECRKSAAPSYAPIFAFYNESHFLGVDATPILTSGKGFDHLYDEIVLGPPIKEMERIGALVPAKICINPINQAKLDKLDKVGGDYNESQLAGLMMSEGVVSDLVKSKQKHAPGMLTIAFAVNVAHSKSIVEKYRKAGIAAAHVDGDTEKDERKNIFKDFDRGKIELLSNVGIATYGFDQPKILAVQDAAPTLSLALYLQKLGRGARTWTEGGKTHYKFLDHANGIAAHGLPNADRKWSLKPRCKASKKETPKQFRLRGDGIDKVVSAREFPAEMEGITLEEIDEATILFWSNCKEFDNIHESIRRGGKKPILAYLRYVRNHREKCGINELRHIERKLGFKPGFAEIRYRQLNER